MQCREYRLSAQYASYFYIFCVFGKFRMIYTEIFIALPPPPFAANSAQFLVRTLKIYIQDIRENTKLLTFF